MNTYISRSESITAISALLPEVALGYTLKRPSKVIGQSEKAIKDLKAQGTPIRLLLRKALSGVWWPAKA